MPGRRGDRSPGDDSLQTICPRLNCRTYRPQRLTTFDAEALLEQTCSCHRLELLQLQRRHTADELFE